jgi:putative membrane protein
MILAFVLGIVCGVFAGMVPGVHINLIASLVLAGSAFLLEHFSGMEFAVFIVAMGITHAFVELVPSIFLGAPDDSTALVMLPGHKMLHEGLGYDAVRFAVIGALGCLLSTLALFPVLLWAFPRLFDMLKPVLGWLLVALVVVLLAKEGRGWWKAGLVFLLTGILGWVVLRRLELSQPLLPLLSGLFGASSLALAIFQNAEIPVQVGRFARLEKSAAAKGIVGGLLGGTLVTLFPGLGPGHAGALATALFRSTSHSYLALTGGLHVADFLASLVTLVALDKARNGALAVMDELVHIGRSDLVLLGGIALFSGVLAAGIALLSAKAFSELVERVNYPWLCAGVLVFLVVLVGLISSWKGLLVLLVSSALGLLAPALKTSRAHAMGCLLVPTILYYL